MAYQSERALAELAALAAVVEHGGFSSAARACGLRKATLSERVRGLELRLGVPLLVRTTRSLRLTDEGSAYVEHARRSLAAAADADAAAVASRGTPTGTLRVTATPALSALLLTAVVAPYMHAHPHVSVEIEATTRAVDLTREGFDVAVRIGRLPDSTLRVRRLGVARGGYYASRAYLARRGTPTRPEDLVHHDTIAMRRGQTMPQWHFASGSRTRSVIVRPRLWASTFELGIQAAVAGLGIVPCSAHAVRAELARKRLVPVLEKWTPPGFEVSALSAPASAVVPKTRVFIDMLAAWFAAQRGWI